MSDYYNHVGYVGRQLLPRTKLNFPLTGVADHPNCKEICEKVAA